MPRPRALVTNDDGIDSPGIATLAAAAVDAGFDVAVAAPSWDSSGAGASLTAVEEHGRVVVSRDRLDGVLDSLDVPAHGVEAAPAFIVRAAVSGVFGPAPNVVLSGVNQGANTGHVVLHSGTVGAAFTASTYGIPALAVSLARGQTWHWDTASAAIEQVLPWFAGVDGPVVLNLNVPGVERTALQGVAAARLARFGAVQANVTEQGSGWVRLAYEPAAGDREPGTDAALLDEGYATITSIVGVCDGSTKDLEGLALA